MPRLRTDCRRLQRRRFSSSLSGLQDHRQAGKVLSASRNYAFGSPRGFRGADAFTDIARFGSKKIDLLQRFQLYPNRTPLA